MSAIASGIGGGWGGLRATKGLVNLFPDVNGFLDRRAQFYQNGQNIDINDQTAFTDGLAVTKYRNLTRNNTPGQSLDFSDIDFPIFRLAEMYLIYDEAVLRGGTGGDMATALSYFNKLRTRAYGNPSGNVASITTDMILDERGRELYWEGFRRTDLVRYGKFTTAAYLWPWKGGVKPGRAVEDFRNIYPIPADDVTANSNLHQNPGY